MKSTGKTRVLVVGAGAIAQYAVMPVYPRLHEVAEVVAVADLREDRAKAVADVVGGRAYSSLAEALQNEEVDAVDVRVPHPAHRDMVLTAVAAGKHVLVEKPIATTYADGAQMVAAAHEAGVVLAVAENYSFFEPVSVVHDMLADGAIGTLLISRTHRVTNITGIWARDGWRTDAAKGGGGVLMDQGTHFTNLLRRTVGEIVEVHAYGSNRREGWVGEDSAVVNLRFADGSIGQQFYTWGTASTEPPVEAAFYGSEGSVEIRTGYASPGGGVVLFRPDLPGGSRKVLDSADYTPSGQAVVEDFLAAVRGEKEPTMSGDEGLADFSVVWAAYESLRTGGPVSVASIKERP